MTVFLNRITINHILPSSIFFSIITYVYKPEKNEENNGKKLQ